MAVLVFHGGHLTAQTLRPRVRARLVSAERTLGGVRYAVVARPEPVGLGWGIDVRATVRALDRQEHTFPPRDLLDEDSAAGGRGYELGETYFLSSCCDCSPIVLRPGAPIRLRRFLGDGDRRMQPGDWLEAHLTFNTVGFELVQFWFRLHVLRDGTVTVERRARPHDE